jgi:hypothetical protein
MREKIIRWFIDDIKENILWSDADVSVERLQEIAEEKTDDLISKCLTAKKEE